MVPPHDQEENLTPDQSEGDQSPDMPKDGETILDPEPLAEELRIEQETPEPSTVDPSPTRSEEEFLQMKDRMLRALAETENVRRRTQREIADAKTFGVTQFARDILTVQDNLSLALASIDEEMREQAEGGIKAFIEGVELTGKDFLSTLERHGVVLIETDGTKFDPNRHVSVRDLESEEVAPGTVIQTSRTGYAIGERILRPAQVVIAKAKKPAPDQTDKAAEA